MESWQKALAVAGAAAGLCAIALCAAKGSSGQEASVAGGENKFAPAAGVTKEKLRQILQEVLQSQKEMEELMQKLVGELRAKPMSFEETYQHVRKIAPSDPLDKHGLKALEFDALLDQHQNDQGVRDAIAKIMGMPTPSSKTPESVQQITVKQIVDVHAFMLAELLAFLESYDAKSHDAKVAVVAVQALIGAKIEEKFKLTSKDVEGAVLMHHTMLATDADFGRLSVDIQQAMGKITGTPFSPN